MFAVPLMPGVTSADLMVTTPSVMATTILPEKAMLETEKPQLTHVKTFLGPVMVSQPWIEGKSIFQA